MPLIAVEQGWSETETAEKGSLLMGLFYAGYGLANIFLTPIGAKFGPRKSLVVIILLWSLFTAMGAILSQVLMLFMASRILLGISEGIHPPMMNQLTNRWFAPEERARANAVWVSGLFIAVLSAPLILVPIMERYGWRTGFYVLAIGGIMISLPLVMRFIYNQPSDHPRVGRELAAELEANAGRIDVEDRPIWTLLASRPYQLMIGAGILNNAVSLGFAGWLPTYLANIDGVQYGDLAWLAAIPYGASLLGLALWAQIGDRTNRRALTAACGMFCAGVMAVGALTAGGAGVVWLTVTLLSFSVFFISAFTAAEFATVQRIVPRAQVANGVGLYNGLTTLVGGGFGPFIVGGIVDGGANPKDIGIIFGLCLAISVLLTLFSRRVAY